MRLMAFTPALHEPDIFRRPLYRSRPNDVTRNLGVGIIFFEVFIFSGNDYDTQLL